MSYYHSWLYQLAQNVEQKKALDRKNSTVVIAGPGSGKTRVLALKVAQLLKEEIIAPQGVVCLTFTRMMAKELESRLYSFGITDRPNVVINTVHGFCLGHVVTPFAQMFGLDVPFPIRIASKSIVDECFRQAMLELGFPCDSETIHSVLQRFNQYRRQRIDIPLDKWSDHSEIAQLIGLYETLLSRKKLIDFDVVIKVALILIINEKFVRTSLSARFPWFAVDEYQDLGYPLYKIVTEMIDRTSVKLFAIGDPDQCIYNFTGTDPKYLLKLSNRDDFRPSIQLDRNYRSTHELMRISQVILGETRNHETEKEGGSCTIYECTKGFPQQLEILYTLILNLQKSGMCNNEIVILHRWREGLRQTAKFLDSKNVDYVLDKNEYYDRRMISIGWLEDLAYWCIRGWSGQDDEGYTRSTFDELLATWLKFGYRKEQNIEGIANHNRIFLAEVLWGLRSPHQLIGPWLQQVTSALNLCVIFKEYGYEYPDEADEFFKLLELTKQGEPLEKLSLAKFANSNPCIELTTIHSSKGTEFEAVIIAGIEQIEESKNGRRLFYVGATRAKRYLFLLYTRDLKYPGARYPSLPLYIKELKTTAKKNKWTFIKHRTL